MVDLVDISFSFGNERIRSGDEIKIGVTYKNRSENILNEAVMGIHLPPGFVINREKTPESYFTKNSIINIGKIDAGGAGSVEIYGQIYAEPGKDEKITGYFSYVRGDNNKKEQKVSSAIFRAAGSVLTAELTMPTSSFGSRELPASIKLSNFGTTHISDVSIKHSGIPPFLPETKTKSIQLKQNETKLFSGNVISPAQSGTYNQTFEIGLIVNNTYIRQISLEKDLVVYSPDTISHAKIDSNIPYADGGQIIPVKLDWKNESQFNLKNIRIRISPTPGIVDLKTTARENNLKIENDDLVADKNTRTALANGNPGSSDEFTVNLYLLKRFNAQGQTTFTISPKVEAEISDMPGQIFTREGTGSTLPIATQIFLNIRPIYYTAEGDQLGRGPLPPKVGETTKYWIAATVDNGANAIANNKFQASLGNGIQFTGKQSVTIGPEIKYDAGSNTVSWSYNLVPAMSEVGLYFEVSVTPNESQIGKKIILIKNSAYSATDDVLGKTLSDLSGSVDNALLTDDQGRYQGAEVIE